MNSFERLSALSSIVVDSGDIEYVLKYQPVDATTNPSLIYKAACLPIYASLIPEAIKACLAASVPHGQRLSAICDHLSILIGKQIEAHIPGVISTEVDARLSYDTDACVKKARELIALYKSYGVSKNKVLIKLASTWEGIRAAEVLEKEGIRCNLTLLFSFAQAKACADAGVTLISPFVGRITDWYKAKQPEVLYHCDPGVDSVRNIYHYYKQHGYQTIVMGASFRTPEQVLALAGCDKLTVSPAVLQQLVNSDLPVSRALAFSGSVSGKPEKMTESAFRWEHNSDPMAVEKLTEGIRLFAADQQKLEEMIVDYL
ncbi:transaldolase [Citrobacter sp. NCU1]|uniref:transaldolase n=1 Tax=Citrobacter sp. NCU1 TaxID=2026683 RepID=UPI001391E247|nr:transaldolase [Citrobacter sp. NCU1]NDO83781.1 transaldolase [Citrobacter sp. NCU1]